jgi:hypothetical protein
MASMVPACKPPALIAVGFLMSGRWPASTSATGIGDSRLHHRPAHPLTYSIARHRIRNGVYIAIAAFADGPRGAPVMRRRRRVHRVFRGRLSLSPDDGPGTLDGMHGRQASGYGAELAETIRLAWPVIGAELGWMFMGVVDTLMVGRLAPEAIGAVGLGGILFFTVAVFGMGVLLGLDTFVSQAFGAGNLDECHRWLRAGVHLSFLLAPAVMLATWTACRRCVADLHPQVRA